MHRTIYYSLSTAILALAILAILGGESIRAQTTDRFTAELEDFPANFVAVAEPQLSRAEVDTLRWFILHWESDTLSADQKQQIVSVSNDLFRKTQTSTRHFYTLAKLILEYPDNEAFSREYSTWMSGLEQLAQDPGVNISTINRFISNSLNLFTRNIIFTNPSFNWVSSSNNYTLRLDPIITIHFNSIDLFCTSRNDSLTIYGTSGVFYPLQHTWEGEGGKVTWERSLLPADEIYAELTDYSINLTRNDYKADSVWFTNRDYFREPVQGELTDKMMRGTRPENIAFPEFHTYEQRHRIRNLFQGVDYDGGYYMMGARLIGSGTAEKPAVIEIKREGADFMRITSSTFIFDRQLIQSDFASVLLRFEQDSMFHSGLGFTYNDNLREVALAPTSLLTTQSPIISSYHNFSIFFNQITWNIDRSELTIGAATGSSQGRAIFESNNFFNDEAFTYLMGRDEQHPLFAINNYTRRIGRRTFDAEGFSRFLRKSVPQTRIQLMRLAMMGYIYYDAETTTAQALPKLYDALRASGRLIDYDVIRFMSTTTDRTPNAVLDLNSLEMHIKGVANISVSDSQNVALSPARNELILRDDRSFSFDGQVEAGLFTFIGNGFDFNYKDFTIEMDSVRRMHVGYQTDEYDLQGRRRISNVLSSLENISGIINIDKPNNKSGLQQNPDYPIFYSTQNAYVYYDSKSIHNGVYKRSNFYFEIYPFTFKRINNFKAEDVTFKGIFYSADIFSPIEDTLIVQADNSLGFIRQLPPEGYPIYQGKGNYYNRLDLSNKGLRGHGDFTYITSRTSSEEFFFFPDSLTTQSYEFKITEQSRGIEYPNLIGTIHQVDWMPYKDRLTVAKGRQPFTMFKDRSDLSGNLLLTPLGLTADGRMDMRKAVMEANHYTFNHLNFNSDTASLVMYVPEQDSVAFKSDTLKAYIDYNANKGEFNKVGESIYADMEMMMYRAHMDEFTWDIERNELTMATPSYQKAAEMHRFHVTRMHDKDSIPTGSLFYSVHGKEDSLYFFSRVANYNLAKPNLKADSVPYLYVADAQIIPKNKYIEVDAKERVQTLRQSDIYANLSDRHHHFYSANINIESRKSYRANGIIDYVDVNEDRQPIAINEIKVDRKMNTLAEATVTAPDSFMLSPTFNYIGNFSIDAREEFWHFNGGAQPVHPCQHITSQWVVFESSINPNDVLIPIPERPINLNHVYLMSGSVISSDSIHLYPGLLTARKDYSDRPLIHSQGYMRFNQNNHRFQIGPMHKLENPDTTGNLVALSKDLCMIFSEGTVDLPVDLGQVDAQFSGRMTHNFEDSTLTSDLILTLDFFLYEPALDVMAADILAKEGLRSTDLKRRAFNNTLQLRCTPQEIEAVNNQLELFSNLTEVPDGLKSTITFSEVRLTWDPVNRSFVSQGQLGIQSIGSTVVNKRVDGFIEIIKRTSGDWMMMYIELEPNKYYSFYYNRRSMQVSSHNQDFTYPIDNQRARERRIRVRAGEPSYNYVLGTRRELDRVRGRYYQITGKTPTGEEQELEEQLEKEEGIDSEKEEYLELELELELDPMLEQEDALQPDPEQEQEEIQSTPEHTQPQDE